MLLPVQSHGGAGEKVWMSSRPLTVFGAARHRKKSMSVDGGLDRYTVLKYAHAVHFTHVLSPKMPA